MPVKIGDQDYITVAERVDKFRDEHPDWQIKTELLNNTNYILMRAEIYDQDGKFISSGHAEEERDSNYINKTSALENAETGAVGRALAFFGYAGKEIASADEIVQAQAQLVEKEMQERARRTMQATMENIDSILEIKAAIADDQPTRVAECWHEIEAEHKAAIWVAPTKGGPFTTAEREYFKSNDYSEARNAILGFVVEESEESGLNSKQQNDEA